ncbi:MAG: ATP-binding protein [Anaerolineae bacterium]|jgi:serine/threonine-protein kinase RsbW
MRKARRRAFPARYESLAAIGHFVARAAEQAGFDECGVYQVELAVDEACSNIIEHAYGGEGRGVIECSCRVHDEGLTVELRDQGLPFDPGSVPQPNLGANIEERTLGGLGLFFIHNLMDEVEFDFESEAGNILTLVKRKEKNC